MTGRNAIDRPRLAESAEDLWAAVKKINGGVVEPGNGYRLTYPTLRVVAGDDFRIDARGQLQIVDQRSAGMCVRDATPTQADEFHRDLSADRVQVLLLTSPRARERLPATALRARAAQPLGEQLPDSPATADHLRGSGMSEAVTATAMRRGDVAQTWFDPGAGKTGGAIIIYREAIGVGAQAPGSPCETSCWRGRL